MNIVKPVARNFRTSTQVMPVSVVSDWQDICTVIASAESGSAVSGGVVVNPSAITRLGQAWYKVGGLGTIVKLRLKYKDAVTSGSVVIQLFGRSESGQCEPLLVDDSNEYTLAVDSANDVRDGTWRYTAPIEVDAEGCQYVIAAIKTAFDGSDTEGAVQAKVK